MEEEAVKLVELKAERLRLEREAFELEKARFAEAKAHAEDVSRLERPRRGSPWLASLLAMVCFLLGILVGAGYCEHREQNRKASRLKEALSQLQSVDIAELQAALSPSNRAPDKVSGSAPIGAHRGVSVIVVE